MRGYLYISSCLPLFIEGIKIIKCLRLDLMKTTSLWSKSIISRTLFYQHRKPTNHCPDGLKVKGMMMGRGDQPGMGPSQPHCVTGGTHAVVVPMPWQGRQDERGDSGGGSVCSITPAATEGRSRRGDDKRPHKGLIGTPLPIQLSNKRLGVR